MTEQDLKDIIFELVYYMQFYTICDEINKTISIRYRSPQQGNEIFNYLKPHVTFIGVQTLEDGIKVVTYKFK